MSIITTVLHPSFEKIVSTSKKQLNYAGVQGKSNAYHNVNKAQNSFIDALILNLIDIVVCVGFALYSSMLFARDR